LQTFCPIRMFIIVLRNSSLYPKQLSVFCRLVHGNGIPMGIPCETSHGMDGTGINCYGMGMGQINMSHGQP